MEHDVEFVGSTWARESRTCRAGRELSIRPVNVFDAVGRVIGGGWYVRLTNARRYCRVLQNLSMALIDETRSRDVGTGALARERTGG